MGDRPREGGIGKGGGRGRHGNGDKALSHALSWALRHSALSIGLKMSPDGYVVLDDVLASSHPRFAQHAWTEADVRRVVADSDKQRFRLEYRAVGGRDDVLCIRANQGHSIPNLVCSELLTPISADELRCLDTIVHGTYREAWEKHIQTEGLSKMKRNHIHMASGLPDGEKPVISGMRKSCQIHIYIDGCKCAEDCVPFFRSDNGVILTAGVSGGILPLKYISKVIDVKSGEVLLDQRSSFDDGNNQ
jgi:2'-phosphotransferase